MNLTALLPLLALAWTTPGFAGISESASYANRGFQQVLLRCPERIWPGADWRDLQIMFSDPDERNAWLISRSANSPEIVRKDQTVEDIFEVGFKVGFLDFRGKRTVAVNTEGLSPEAAFRLAVHELFREAAQSQWDTPDFDERGTLYPLLPEPRYMRRMAFDSLKKAFTAINEKRSPKAALEAAAWWTQRWRKAYPEELPMRTDSVEGTALYAEQLSYLFAEEGCGVRGAGFYTAFQRHVEPEMELTHDELLPPEGMSLGSLSSFILTSTQPGWFAKMNGRLMPSDLVLNGSKPVPQAEDPELRRDYDQIVASQQARAYRRLNPTLEKEKNQAYARVSIPARWQKGELSLENSYVLRNRRDTAILLFDDNHDFRSDRGTIHIPSGGTVYQTERNNGCGGHFHFLIPVRDLSAYGRRISGLHWWLRFDVEGTRKTVNGFTWICPRE